MTKEEILSRVEEIKILSNNESRAHLKEDMLYLDFIKYVAKSKTEFGELAKLVLRTRRYKFFRKC